MNELRQHTDSPILYVASRLPALSETFVHREMSGLMSRGRRVLGASVRAPHHMVNDPAMTALAQDVVVIYELRTFARLPIALASQPLLFLGAISDAIHSDHVSLTSRIKHVFQAAMGLSLAWRLRNLKISRVHAHMAHVPATVGLYVARALGARFSFTGHAADLFVQRAGLKFKLEHASFVSCISEWHQRFYQSIAEMDPVRLPLIRCSVALPGEIKDRKREIVTVARLVPKKGIDVLLSAFALCDLPNWHLRIIGDGPQGNELRALARTLGLEQRVIFEGPKPHSACLLAIANAGMFVIPCRTSANGDQDGIPVALMEAMAASRPVICGDLPTIRELVQDGQSGLLVAQGDSERLAAAIARVAGDDQLADKLGACARKRVEAEFSDAINLDRLCAAFDNSAPRLAP
jgi:colanic acid/amylovoran biosynthesis glycosyltransferase